MSNINEIVALSAKRTSFANQKVDKLAVNHARGDSGDVESIRSSNMSKKRHSNIFEPRSESE